MWYDVVVCGSAGNATITTTRVFTGRVVTIVSLLTWLRRVAALYNVGQKLSLIMEMLVKGRRKRQVKMAKAFKQC